MFGTLIKLHAILADSITTIGFLYRFARWILSKIRLSSVSYRLRTGFLIGIYIKNNVKLLNFTGGGYSL